MGVFYFIFWPILFDLSRLSIFTSSLQILFLFTSVLSVLYAKYAKFLDKSSQTFTKMFGKILFLIDSLSHSYTKNVLKLQSSDRNRHSPTHQYEFYTAWASTHTLLVTMCGEYVNTRNK